MHSFFFFNRSIENIVFNKRDDEAQVIGEITRNEEQVFQQKGACNIALKTE